MSLSKAAAIALGERLAGEADERDCGREPEARRLEVLGVRMIFVGASCGRKGVFYDREEEAGEWLRWLGSLGELESSCMSDKQHVMGLGCFEDRVPARCHTGVNARVIECVVGDSPP
jgi:hypothetical protein